MTADALAVINRDCYCLPVERSDIIRHIVAQNAAPTMADMLSERPHYFANTSVFLSAENSEAMTRQISAIETVAASPGYIEAVTRRAQSELILRPTKGVFMGYDFHLTDDGPRLIEINSNAGGAFIVNMIEEATRLSSGKFNRIIADMFRSEWRLSGRAGDFKTLAIIDENPTEQFHYPDMCLAKSGLEAQGYQVIIADPSALKLKDGAIFHDGLKIDVIYNRLTDFDLSEPANTVIARAYNEDVAVVTPAPHTHALFADKRNLIWLSDDEVLTEMGIPQEVRDDLRTMTRTRAVTDETAAQMWNARRTLFFKPQAGYGSRGAFRGAKLTKKVWSDILKGGYIAQERILPPLRAVSVGDEKKELKFDVRVYTYDGTPLLLAARIYQGQTTNLRTEGGGLAAVRTQSVVENFNVEACQKFSA